MLFQMNLLNTSGNSLYERELQKNFKTVSLKSFSFCFSFKWNCKLQVNWFILRTARVDLPRRRNWVWRTLRWQHEQYWRWLSESQFKASSASLFARELEHSLIRELSWTLLQIRIENHLKFFLQNYSLFRGLWNTIETSRTLGGTRLENCCYNKSCSTLKRD